MARKSNTSIKTKVYGSFKGVDFNSDPSVVSDYRSPLSVNMISDEGGNPEKRPGYQRILAMSESINGLYQFKCDHNDLLGIVLTKNGTAVDNPDVSVSDAIYTKTGVYGATTVNISVASSVYTITVTCGTYTATHTETTHAGAITKLSEYGIRFGYTIDGTYVLTFTTAKHKLCDKHNLVHSGTAIYRWYEDGTTELLLDIDCTNQSTAVFLNKMLYIFTGKKLYVYNGNTISTAESNAYIPTTVIGREPGSTPGGTTYEGINYLTPYQKVSFKGDGTETAYVLPYTDATDVTVWVDDEEQTEGTDYTYASGTVTFTSGSIPPAPSAGAADNVVIQFSHYVAGYADRINHCTIATNWGVNGATDRIVCSGDVNFPNRDYISGYLNGCYFSDTDYSIVGTDFTNIVGYRRLGSYLAIIKEDNGQDSSVFIRSASLDDDGNALWATYPCLSGVGGVSRFGYGNIADDQLILTANGVYAITSNAITSEKIAEMRSKYVNPKLKKEDLSTAVCVSFRNMFIVFCANGHAYVLDGRQPKSYSQSSSNTTTFNYEGFYWENCPANCVMVDTEDGVENLYFGTTEGNVYRFMWDEERMIKYSDGGYYTGTAWTNGAAITASWATKSDDDGDPMILKTMLKKGDGVTLKPFSRSSAKVCIRTDRDTVDWQCNSNSIDIFDWDNIDFSRVSFDSNDAPREVVFNRKVKNYKRLQIIIRNNTVNEGFGVYKITKHYVIGNFAKR